MKKLGILLLVLCLCGCTSSQKDTGSDTNNKENVKVEEKQSTKTMTLVVDSKEYKVTLLTNKSAASLLSLAPLDLNCAKDSYGYYSQLDNSLNAQDTHVTSLKLGDLYLKGGNTLYIANKSQKVDMKITRLGSVEASGVKALAKQSICQLKK